MSAVRSLTSPEGLRPIGMAGNFILKLWFTVAGVFLFVCLVFFFFFAQALGFCFYFKMTLVCIRGECGLVHKYATHFQMFSFNPVIPAVAI